MLGFDEYKEAISIQDAGHKIKLFPLFTKQALAYRWGVNRQTVNNWAARHNDFCKSVEDIVEGAGSYYPMYEVERYEKMRGLKVNGNAPK